MKAWTFRWNLLLCMAAIATAFLVAPPVAKAQMIPSQMQSGRVLALVRQQLRSELMQQQIQRFGLSEGEARQIQMVLSDERVIREMDQMGRQLASTSKAMIKHTVACRLMNVVESSVRKHMDRELRQRLCQRVERAFGSGRLYASQVSGKGGMLSTRQALSTLQRSLTTERLTALGMAERDARQIVDRLEDNDVGRILRNDIRIGFAADIKAGPGGKVLFYTALFALFLLGVTLIVGGNTEAVLPIAATLGTIALVIVFLGWLFTKR